MGGLLQGLRRCRALAGLLMSLEVVVQALGSRGLH